MGIEGSLGEISIVDVLQLLHLTRKSGMLHVFGRGGAASVAFADGKIVGARHPARGVNVGRLLVETGAVRQEDIDEAVARQRTAGVARQPLVVTLVQMGRLDRDDGWHALVKLIEATIAELVAWQSGRFVFEADDVAIADGFSHIPDGVAGEVSVDTQAALLEALRVYDERQRQGPSEPAVGGDRLAAGASGCPACSATTDCPRGHVLVVDDDKPTQRALQRVLEQIGYATRIAASSAEALRLVDAEKFDAAVVDYRLPGPEGLDVLRHVRTVQPRCERFLLSGYLDLDVVVDAVNLCEVKRIFEKPIMYDTVAAIVAETLAMRPGARPVTRPADQPSAAARMLNDCFAGDLFKLALQPIVSAATLDIFGFEALLRCDGSCFAGALAVLRAAEQVGRIDELADVVARKAGQWLATFPDRFKLFVNMHPRELANPDAVEARVAALARWRHRLILEVTERERLPAEEILATSLAVLRGHGFALALDDLGSGYSSLSTLAEFKTEFVKIDRSLVRHVCRDARRWELVEILTNSAKRAGAWVVAEGVETAEDAEALRRCGVDYFQGFLFGRPSLTPRIVFHGGRFRFGNAPSLPVAQIAAQVR